MKPFQDSQIVLTFCVTDGLGSTYESVVYLNIF